MAPGPISWRPGPADKSGSGRHGCRRALQAGPAEIEITPPLGTRKIGWLKVLVPEKVLDPLHARAAVFERGRERVGFIQLDTLSIRWSQVNAIRRRLKRELRFPGDAVMVAATHNHGGPAVANCGRVERDEKYMAWLTDRCVEVFGQALAGLHDANLGFKHVFDFAVAKNRRVVMRDGTVHTHGTFNDPLALCFEGPIDPEVAVLAARDPKGNLLGCLVNYACHPTHHGGGDAFTAGYPGVLVKELKQWGCPTTLLLNGPCGNVHTADPTVGQDMPMEEAGKRLAADARQAIEAMTFTGEWPLAASRLKVELPYRRLSKAEMAGHIHGAQRFASDEIYNADMPTLMARVKRQGTQPAEIQALFTGEVAWVAIPAEYFVEYGLRIKEATHPRHTLVVATANGMVGYVPTAAAFKRGGYETTLAMSSRLGPKAGDILADGAIALVRDQGR